jgi:hypothetical protein
VSEEVHETQAGALTCPSVDLQARGGLANARGERAEDILGFELETVYNTKPGV